MTILDFINNWQNLIGALIGSFVAIVGSILVNLYINYRTKIREQKRQYSNLLLILSELQLFINRCEGYLNFIREGKVSFNKIVFNNRVSYVAPSQVFDLNSQVYDKIQKIYNIAEVIKYNLDKSEVLETTKYKTKKEDVEAIYIQNSIICNRYGSGLNFIKHYLEDIYHNFNYVAVEIFKLSKKYKHLNFPKNIQIYSLDYVKEKVKKYDLKLGKLDDY